MPDICYKVGLISNCKYGRGTCQNDTKTKFTVTFLSSLLFCFLCTLLFTSANNLCRLNFIRRVKIGIVSDSQQKKFEDIYVCMRVCVVVDLCVLIFCLNYIFLISHDLIKQNSLTVKRQKVGWYLAESMTDTDYKDEQVLLANLPSKQILKQAVWRIGLYENENKIDFMCFK